MRPEKSKSTDRGGGEGRRRVEGGSNEFPENRGGEPPNEILAAFIQFLYLIKLFYSGFAESLYIKFIINFWGENKQ